MTNRPASIIVLQIERAEPQRPPIKHFYMLAGYFGHWQEVRPFLVSELP